MTHEDLCPRVRLKQYLTALSRAIEDGRMINLDTCAFAKTTSVPVPVIVRQTIVLRYAYDVDQVKESRSRDKERRPVSQGPPIACPMDLRKEL